MKLQITKIEGSNPTGMGVPAADPRGPQSVHVTATGLTSHAVIVISGPVPDAHGQPVPDTVQTRGYNWPALANVDKDGCDVVMNLPIRGPYQAVAIVGTDVSDWFSFSVI